MLDSGRCFPDCVQCHLCHEFRIKTLSHFPDLPFVYLSYQKSILTTGLKKPVHYRFFKQGFLFLVLKLKSIIQLRLVIALCNEMDHVVNFTNDGIFNNILRLLKHQQIILFGYNLNQFP